MTRKKLTFILAPRQELSSSQADRLFELMRDSYDHVSEARFFNDLENKQFVGLLCNPQGSIEGFTTFGINPGQTGTDAYNIIFSGDTVISPQSWGTSEMITGGLHAAGRIMAHDTTRKWYWFLISKGHRTYLYLPFYFHHFYPSPELNGHSAKLRSIVEHCAGKLYPGHWDPEKGVISFQQPHGQLKAGLAKATFDKKDKKHVAFFLQKNPHFHRGDELACITELSPENVREKARNHLINGLNDPVRGW